MWDNVFIVGLPPVRGIVERCLMATRKALVSFSFVDVIGVPGSTNLYADVDDTKTVAQVMTDLGLLATDIQDISNASLIEARVELLDIIVSPPAAADTSESERGVLINWRQTGSTYKYGVWIPSVDPALIVDGHVVVTTGAIAALASLIESPMTALTIVSKYFLTLPSIADAAEAFRKLRRRAEKITKVFE